MNLVEIELKRFFHWDWLRSPTTIVNLKTLLRDKETRGATVTYANVSRNFPRERLQEILKEVENDRKGTKKRRRRRRNRNKINKTVL